MADNENQAADWLSYQYSGGTVRNRPLSRELTDALSFLPEMGITMEVFSGGQPRRGSGLPRVGSTRHDDGHAADAFFSLNGRRLNWANPEDIPVFQEIVRRSRERGVTGFGAGPNYMPEGSMHIGFGNEAVWGSSLTYATSPQWLRDAFEGTPQGQTPDLSSTVYEQALNDFEPVAGYAQQAVDDVNNAPVATYRSIADDRDNDQQAEDDRPSWWQGAGMAVNEEWIATNVARQMGREEFTPDPNFTLSEELWKEVTDGMDEVYQSGLHSATSEAHLRALAEQMRNEQNVDQELASLGYGGMGLRMGAAILDPAAIAVSAATSGFAAPVVYGQKVSRVGRILRGGVAAGATNAGIDGYLASQDQTMGWEDVAISAAAGFVLGGTMGGLQRSTPEDRAMVAAVQEAEGDNIRRMFEGGTPDGSMGAARVPQDPDLSPAEIVSRESANAPTTAFSSVRIDSSNTLKSSLSGIMRRLGGGLVEDGVGNADRTTNRFAVSESVAREERVRLGRFYRTYNSAYRDWLRDQGKRLFWQHGVAERTDFNRQVAMAVRREIDAPSNAHVAKAAAQMKKEFADLLEFGKQMGIRGFDEVKANHNYMVRRHRIDRLDDLVAEFGGGAINRMVAESIQKANRKWRNRHPGRADYLDEIDYEDALKMADAYVKSIRGRRYGEFSLNRALSGQDMDTLKMMLDDAGMSSEEVTRITDKVRFSKDTGEQGRISNAKWRLDLDETHRGTLIPLKGGPAREIGIEDFLDNDAESLFAQYVRSVTAEGYMEDFLKEFRVRDAEGNLPIHAPSFETVKGYIAKEAGEKGMSSKQLAKEMATLDRAYKLIKGIALEPPSNWRTQARMLRDYNFSRIGGQLGVAQLAEMGNVLGNGGLRVLLQNIPALRSIYANVRTGKFSNELQNEIEAVWGFGTDLERMNMSAIFDESGAVEQAAGSRGQRLDHGLQRMKRMTVVGSGMGHVNMALQRLNARVLVQRFMDDASGRRGINPNRLRVMGVSEELHPRIQEQLRKHVDQTTGMLGKKVERINIEKWDDIDAKNAFINGVDRWAKKSIQENDIGNMPDFMSYELGKVIGQFRSFMLAAYVKQTLAGMHARDWEVFSAFATSMLFGGLFYVGQQHVNSLGRSDRDEFLEDRLNPASLASAAFQRSAFSSVIPLGVDTVREIVGLEPIFDFRSSGLKGGGGPVGAFLGNPTGDLIDGTFRGVGGAVQGAVNPDYDFSQRDAQSLTKLLAFQNMFGVRNMMSVISDPLPEQSQ